MNEQNFTPQHVIFANFALHFGLACEISGVSSSWMPQQWVFVLVGLIHWPVCIHFNAFFRSNRYFPVDKYCMRLHPSCTYTINAPSDRIFVRTGFYQLCLQWLGVKHDVKQAFWMKGAAWVNVTFRMGCGLESVSSSSLLTSAICNESANWSLTSALSELLGRTWWLCTVMVQ